jgi:hypothetical protein
VYRVQGVRPAQRADRRVYVMSRARLAHASHSEARRLRPSRSCPQTRACHGLLCTTKGDYPLCIAIDAQLL